MSYWVNIRRDFASYVGIDLHTTALTLLWLNRDTGEETKTTIPTHCTGKLLSFIRSLPKPVCVGIESMGSFYWLWDLLISEVDEIMLLDALDLSKLAPREASTDEKTCQRILRVLTDGCVPQCFVPAKHIRHLRQLGRQWHVVTEMAARCKVQLRWQLFQNNHRGPAQITAASMQRWMTAQAHKIEAIPHLIMNNYHQIVVSSERIRIDLRREMLAIVREHEVLRKHLDIIKSTRGIDDILGIIILAEFGDFFRFKDADAVACWTGLTERTHISNRQKYPGRISKAGSSTLRWALCEAAHGLICSDTKYHLMHQRIKRKRANAGIARVAMARRVSRYLWKMVVSDTPFQAGESRKRTARANQVRLGRQRKAKARMDNIAKQERITKSVMTP